jgi:hypothetical protein
MYSAIYSMRKDLEKIKKPQGTRENPVRTCKDLYYGHPQFKDGMQFYYYFIFYYFMWLSESTYEIYAKS